MNNPNENVPEEEAKVQDAAAAPEEKEPEKDKKEKEKKKSKSKELEEQKAALAEMENKYVRVLAEYDNYRKRSLREHDSAFDNGLCSALEAMLPVLDNLERAAAFDPEAGKAEGEDENVKNGVALITRQFRDVLTKLGVEEIKAEGAFDPAYCNAVMVVEKEGAEENTIVDVLQKGYRKGDHILRHAMVSVAQ